jgi:hypothetical protein
MLLEQKMDALDAQILGKKGDYFQKSNFKCLILKVIKTLFRYRAVSTTSDLGLVSDGIDTK